MSKIPVTYKRSDLQSDQEVKWCPGCGDYTILASVQNFMAEMGISKEKIVFVSGIGCAARFPYYMNTYGVHSIHGSCLLYTSPSPRDVEESRMPSSA